MARSSTARRAASSDVTDYLAASKKPLHILVFLLPLILAYELALPWLIASRGRDVKAHRGIVQFFEAFGVTSGALYLGGAVIVAVLLVWHLLHRDPWKVSWFTIALMAMESLALSIPLLLLSRVVGQSELTAFAGSAVMTPALRPDYAHWAAWEQITLSIGAGLYEELMFRMLLVAMLHTLLVDAGKAAAGLGAAIAVAVAAAAFTWYHPLETANGSLSWRKLVFYFIAGLYFGTLYLLRGFGIVVAVHALYDIITVVLLHDEP